MTAPTVNGVKYPQPVDELLPAARALAEQLGEVPSRNRLMKEFRIGVPKATELRERLIEGPVPDPWQYAEPIGPDPADTQVRPAVEPGPVAAVEPPAVEPDAQPTTVGHPGTPTPAKPAKPVVVWPVVLLALPAFVAVWSGWVGLGGLTGFGVVYPLPGIWDSLAINTAITLPIGVETYAAFALYVWLSGRVPDRARRFAKWSAIGSLLVGALGQVAYHLLVAAGIDSAPWWITTAVSVLPVAVLGMGAALAHLVRENH